MREEACQTGPKEGAESAERRDELQSHLLNHPGSPAELLLAPF